MKSNRLELTYRKRVQEVIRIVPWPIIKSDCDIAVIHTIVNTYAAVCDVSKLGSCDS